MRIYVDGIGLLGPGLCGWKNDRAVLLGQRPYYGSDLPNPTPSVLPPNEGRRSSEVMRWALQAAEEAMEHAQVKTDEMATIFASSGGEATILHRLCLALATPERVVSPTLFHQSVHNAAAGYWSIGTGSRQPSISLSCYDSSFGGGLLEAAVQVVVEERPVLFVSYDLPPPPPLYAARPLLAGFSVAMVMTKTGSRTGLARLDISLTHEPSGELTRMDEPGLEALRVGNPAARALPLLASIAGGNDATVRLEYLDGQQLLIEVTPCRSCPR